MQVELRVRETIADDLEVDVETVTLKANLTDDLGADSLDKVELVMALEEEFSISISDNDAGKLNTVGDVVKYIESHPND